MNERMEAIVSGRVQLVMYRDFVCRTARGLKLVGTVKNLPDGTVAVCAEGPRPALDRLVQKLGKGSFLAKVDQVRVSWKPAVGVYHTFIIDYD